MVEYGLQVFGIHEEQSLVIGYLIYYGKKGCLQVIKPQHRRHQIRPHLGDGGAQRRALAAVEIPEHRGVSVEIKPCLPEAEFLYSALHILRFPARHAHAGEVALHIGQEYRHSHLGKGLRQDLQRDGLAGSRGSCYQSVSAGHGGIQIYVLPVVLHSYPYLVFCVHIIPPALFSTWQSTYRISQAPGPV